MANKNRFELDIKLAGESFTLRPTLEAIAEMEDLTGLSFQEITEIAQQKKIKSSIVYHVIYSGIKGGGYNKSLEDVSKMCFNHGLFACYPMVYLFLTKAGQSMNPDSAQKKT